MDSSQSQKRPCEPGSEEADEERVLRGPARPPFVETDAKYTWKAGARDGDHGRTALHAAAFSGSVENLNKQNLVGRLNEQDNFGRYPLHYAAMRSNDTGVLVVERLIRESTNLPLHLCCKRLKSKFEKTDNYGKLPLHYAATPEILHALLAAQGAKRNVFAQDHTQRTILHEAALFARTGVLEAVLKMDGAQKHINAKAGPGRSTPLHESYYGGSSEAIELLLAYGADRMIKDRHGLLPSDYAPEKRAAANEKAKKQFEDYKRQKTQTTKNHQSNNKERPPDPRSARGFRESTKLGVFFSNCEC